MRRALGNYANQKRQEYRQRLENSLSQPNERSISGRVSIRAKSKAFCVLLLIYALGYIGYDIYTDIHATLSDSQTQAEQSINPSELEVEYFVLGQGGSIIQVARSLGIEDRFRDIMDFNDITEEEARRMQPSDRVKVPSDWYNK